MVLKHKEESTMAKLEIDEIEIGDSHSEEVLFDLSKIQHFIEFSNDSAGIHVNDLFSKEKGFRCSFKRNRSKSSSKSRSSTFNL